MKKITIIIFSFLLLVTGAAKAQYNDLINFTAASGPDTGSSPMGNLTLSTSGDTLYGMTRNGGNTMGNIFSYDIIGGKYQNLIDFTDNGPYWGSNPDGSLTLSNGILYGMTLSSASVYGNIFSYNPIGNVYTNLIDFTGGGGAYPGSSPEGSLTLSGGVFYGMTSEGGANNDGVIFSYNPVGNVYTDLIDLSAANGSIPNGSLTMAGGILYGMTSQGGANNDGVIFSYNPIGNVYTKLIDFSGTAGTDSGATPNGSLTLSNGILYGMTSQGGANNGGVIFSYNPTGNIYNTIYDFNGLGGTSYELYGALTPSISGDTLYGMTDQIIFSYDLTGNVFKDLFQFNCTTGCQAYGSLTFSRGVLYGMTSGGGTDNQGVIFSFRDTTSVNSISEIKTSLFKVNIYPDPSTGYFTVSGLIQGQSVEIYDCVGQRIDSRIADKTTMDFNITAYASGVYLIKVQNQDGSMAAQKKMVKTQ